MGAQTRSPAGSCTSTHALSYQSRSIRWLHRACSMSLWCQDLGTEPWGAPGMEGLRTAGAAQGTTAEG